MMRNPEVDGGEGRPCGAAVQLVPGAPDAVGGIADFARALAGRLSFMDSVYHAEHHPRHGQLDVLGRSTLLLHYSGYGFAKRGAPMWLAREIAAWRRTIGRRLVVFFHEVYATGPPWRSSFWTWPLQRSVARRLLRACDAAITSLPLYRSALERLAPDRKVAVLAVPSTIGEPETLPIWADRRNRLVVFGTSGVRRRSYESERAALSRMLTRLQVEELLDLGEGEATVPAFSNVKVQCERGLSAGRVSALLAESRFGYLSYPPDLLDKSTVYAAYLAHGLVPICAWSGNGARSQRSDEVWLDAMGTAPGVGAESENISRGTMAAYSGRSLLQHAKLVRRLMDCT